MMKPQALVFDLDDTLYAERDFVLSGFGAVDQWLQRNHELNGFATEAKRLYELGVRGRIFDEALRRLGGEDLLKLVPQMVAVYRAHPPRLSLFADARDVIDTYRGRFKFGLITDGYAQTQRNKVAALELGGVLDHIIYTDDLGREHWKPSSVPFRQMMARLECAGEQCVYVGDNPAKDFVAPNDLQWLTVQIVREDGEYARAGSAVTGSAFPARRVIRELRELAGVLG